MPEQFISNSQWPEPIDRTEATWLRGHTTVDTEEQAPTF